MKRTLTIISLVLGALMSHGLNAQESDPNRAKVVCFGDSITKRGYPAILGEALDVEVVNAGVAGHSSAQGLRRMKKDVIDHEPDVVVIFFGTNDARVDSDRAHVPVEQYESNLVEMVKAIEEAGAQAVICTLPPINEDEYFKRHETDLYDKEGGATKLWGRYRAAALKVAKDRRLPVVDLYGELGKQPKWMSPDGVHPSKEGCRIIARLVGEKVKPLVKN
ncbi:SGNH/GDSL hydrolase family protein [Haloferula sp.]|uniref:SGNH/GDSL hydrolase family protein n=1 Tax=Haloferula sp. TaxID=2497595 RepID=UPI00329BFEDA